VFLAHFGKRGSVGRRLNARELLQVSAGEKTASFCTADDKQIDGLFRGNVVQRGIEIGKNLLIQDVYRTARNVEPEHGETVRLLIDAECFRLEERHGVCPQLPQHRRVTSPWLNCTQLVDEYVRSTWYHFHLSRVVQPWRRTMRAIFWTLLFVTACSGQQAKQD